MNIMNQNKLSIYNTKEHEAESDVALETVSESVRAPMYAVVMHNDNYTTMDFVVYVLVEIFDHGIDRAVELMYQIHESGRAVVAILSFEIGEMKILQVNELAEQMEYPLLTTLEKQ